MRQSDIGPFGVVTLLLALVVQVAALASLQAVGLGPAAVLAALVVSRGVLAAAVHPVVPAGPGRRAGQRGRRHRPPGRRCRVAAGRDPGGRARRARPRRARPEAPGQLVVPDDTAVIVVPGGWFADAADPLVITGAVLSPPRPPWSSGCCWPAAGPPLRRRDRRRLRRLRRAGVHRPARRPRPRPHLTHPRPSPAEVRVLARRGVRSCAPSRAFLRAQPCVLATPAVRSLPVRTRLTHGSRNGGLTTVKISRRPRTSTPTSAPSSTIVGISASPMPLRSVGENVPEVTSHSGTSADQRHAHARPRDAAAGGHQPAQQPLRARPPSRRAARRGPRTRPSSSRPPSRSGPGWG